MQLDILTISYLIGAVTFILGLKMLSNPATARRGNQIAAAGMIIAILATIFLYRDDAGHRLHNYGWIFGGIVIGGTIGTLAARKVKMTAMPEMVSMFNGMGGACAALISIVEFNHIDKIYFQPLLYDKVDFKALNSLPNPSGILIVIVSGLIIGSVSFAGSMIAWGKLNGRIKDFAFNGQHIVNIVILFATLGLAGYLIADLNSSNAFLLYIIFILALLYGVLFVMPIGGADMPVVIS